MIQLLKRVARIVGLERPAREVFRALRGEGLDTMEALGATGALEKVSGIQASSRRQKSALAALITAALPVINPLIDKVLAIPGPVSDILKPAVDGLRTQLAALAKHNCRRNQYLRPID